MPSLNGDSAGLTRLARRQHGIITVQQARALGFSPSTLAKRAAAGSVDRRYRGVYAAPGAPDGYLPRVAAAVLSVPDGAATGSTALGLHGARIDPPPRIEIVTTADHRPRRDDVTLIRSRKLRPRDVTEVSAIRSARPAWAITDASRTLTVEQLAGAIIDLEQAGVPTLSPLFGVMKQRPWFPGRTRVREALDVVTAARYRSLFEVLGAEVLEPLRPFEVNHPVPVRGGRVEVDLAWPEERVAAEWRGFAWHRRPEQLRRDAERHNLLTSEGWRYVVYVWDDLRRPADIVAQLGRVLGR